MKKRRSRWFYAVVGVAVLLLVGLIYAWTVLQAPIAQCYPQWTKGQISLTFTVAMFSFCVGGLVGGLLQKRLVPRVLVWGAAVLFLVGFSIAAAAQALLALYLGFGVFCGFASGLAYNAVLSAVSRWFPDRQGLISGMLLMGFGLGSFVIGKLYTAFTPSDGGDTWRTAFLVLGIALFLLLAVAGCFVVKPWPDWSPKVPACAPAARRSYEEIGPGTMLRRPSFWLYLVWTTVLSAAGLAIISQGTPMALEACPGLSMSGVATIVGLLSIFNGVGRILFGALFDRIGRFGTMLMGGIVFLVATALLLAALKSHGMALLVAAYIVTGLAYGCVTPTNSAFVSLFYGQKNYPVNLPVVNLNMLIASFGSTAAGIVFDRTESYTVIIIVVIALIALGTAVACFIRPPRTAA